MRFTATYFCYNIVRNFHKKRKKSEMKIFDEKSKQQLK